MSELDDVLKRLLNFRKERNWEQFHNPKDIAISLNLEAAEVLEHFQWKNQLEVKEHVKSHKEEEMLYLQVEHRNWRVYVYEWSYSYKYC